MSEGDATGKPEQNQQEKGADDNTALDYCRDTGLSAYASTVKQHTLMRNSRVPPPAVIVSDCTSSYAGAGPTDFCTHNHDIVRRNV